MRIVFLPSSDEDVRWFTRYYRNIFPPGARNARARLEQTLVTLRATPRVGQLVAEPDQRRYRVLRTPFSIVYRIADDRIEILRIRDGRASGGDLDPSEDDA
jgi:plasmid stabilization system protein ParE